MYESRAAECLKLSMAGSHHLCHVNKSDVNPSEKAILLITDEWGPGLLLSRFFQILIQNEPQCLE